MTRFQKLAAATVATTLLLVTIGVVVRATDSGLGCPDWPLCNGQVLPSLGDSKAWIEWTHRLVASIIGILILAMAVIALARYRDRGSILWPTLLAVVLVGFQAYLGEQTVLQGNSGQSVTAHLASAMALLAVLVYILVRSLYPGRIGGRGASQRFTILAAFGAVTTYALLLFGSNVTASDAALVFPDWPLMGGTFFPPLTDVDSSQVLHRWVAVIVGVIVVGIALVAWRTQRSHPAVVRLALAAGVLFPIQAVIGGLQVITKLDPWTQTLHLALGAVIWAAMVGLVVVSYYAARTAVTAGVPGSGIGVGGDGAGRRGRELPTGAAGAVGVAGSAGAATGATSTSQATASDASSPSPSAAPVVPTAVGPAVAVPAAHTARDTVRAYIALTKPRIIELLLVTTVPAMILAAHGIPPLDLIWWTLLGGSLAAGSANAINCYLDRDIDLLMTRTRRRPLPAHEVEPERAVIFGLVLGVIAFAVLAWFVNLLAAFLAMLAIAFYVIVYTLLMKRTTPQNIVIGGAAGALPPVIGWAAVTGNIGLPAAMLFLLVFYWTPPHFWALSLRIRKDYAAAGVPMLPVVRGVPETTRQIALYTFLLVAVSLVLFAVARMGAIYLVAAVVLGAIFVWQALKLWRVGTSPEASTTGAIALYKYSITYLSLLFLAVAVDALITVPITI